MEQDTSGDTETIQTDNDFNTMAYSAEGDHGFREYSEQENSIEVEVPQNKTSINVTNDRETESTSESSYETGMCS